MMCKPFPFMLLLICVSLAGCATTDQERVKAFAISAEQGDAIAQHNLGASYLRPAIFALMIQLAIFWIVFNLL